MWHARVDSELIVMGVGVESANASHTQELAREPNAREQREE
jgi:hypothetical protein